MNATNKSLSVIAFYLSEYNQEALKALGYKTYTEAFREISIIFCKENNYLKLRRDEFDALPESKSQRKGWRNRPPIKDVVEMANYLRLFSFPDLTVLVTTLIENAKEPFTIDIPSSNESLAAPDAVESIINATDGTSGFRVRASASRVRVYKTEIIHQLKYLYTCRCQICGCRCGDKYGSNIVHAHHIDYFSHSLNNDADNILIICPNHHGIIHDTNPIFDTDALVYHYPNGYIEGLAINMHL